MGITVLSDGVFLGLCALVGVEAPHVGKNLPTPEIGVCQRINIGAFMVWVIVLAIALLGVHEAYDMRTPKPIAAS